MGLNVVPGDTLAIFVEISVTPGTAEPLPLPDKPSIAVLPFTNIRLHDNRHTHASHCWAPTIAVLRIVMPARADRVL